MEALKKFFEIWGGFITISIIVVLLLFSLGCCIYTAVINTIVGWLGISGAVCAIGGAVIIAYSEAKSAISRHRLEKKRK